MIYNVFISVVQLGDLVIHMQVYFFYVLLISEGQHRVL